MAAGVCTGPFWRHPSYTPSVPRLVFIMRSRTPLDPVRGLVAIDDKTRTGLEAHAALWPGEVVFLSLPGPVEEAAVGRPVDSLGFGVEVAEDMSHAAERLVGPGDLAVLPLSPGVVTEHLGILDRSVLELEIPPVERLMRDLDVTSGAARRARVRAGAVRWEQRCRRYIKQARGLLCNGLPAYRSLGHLRADTHLHFDSCITAEMVQAERPVIDGPFTMAFSGRFIDIKGPGYAVEVARELARRGVDVRLLMMGRGELEAQLRATAGPETTFMGYLPFSETWVPTVRDQVDLMVLPHTQGDPAGTYLEAAGAGVPTLGFDNRCLSSLVEVAGLGWTVPMRDVVALADVAEHLATRPPELLAAGRKARSFMRRHTIEQETAGRVDALLRALGS